MATISRRWTVVTWNVQGRKRTDLDRVAGELERHTPDVVLLQEVRRPQAAELAKRLGLHHHWMFKHHAFAPLFPRFAEGAAILSPHVVRDCGSAVVSDATSKRSWRRRIVVWALVERNDHSAYRVFNAHLSPHELRTQRLDEADRITAIAERFGDSPPIITGGDLNDHGEPEVLERLPGIEHVPVPPTNPASAPVNTLDHVLLPADATDVELDVPSGGPQWDRVSDHLPVMVRFSMDWVAGDFT
ncbi:MAG: endonuclease/exonuclease/phosphatase family protein [Actinomycetota bacterium]